MAWALIGLGSNLGGLGSNLGGSRSNLQRAITAIAQLPHVYPLRTSRFFASNPAGGPVGQPRFCNAALLLETSLSPASLLRALQRIETNLGRERKERWAARTIDLDILMFENTQLESPALTLPHPRMSFRRFMLEPAVEIAGEFVHAPTGWSLQQLLDHQKAGPVWIALTGPKASQKKREAIVTTFVARGIARTCDNLRDVGFCETRQQTESETARTLLDTIEKYAHSIRACLKTKLLKHVESKEVVDGVLAKDRKEKQPCLPLVVPYCLVESVDAWIESLDVAKALRLSLRQKASAALESVPKPTLVVSFGMKKPYRNRPYSIEGPNLWLGNASEEEAKSEIAAALVAMQPVDVLE